MDDGLNKVFETMASGQVPNWLEIMTAISNVTELVTLDERPPEQPEPLTICELNGKNCCGD